MSVIRLGKLDLELTERCNNNCLHCGINRSSSSAVIKKELTTHQLQAILREAASLGCLTVRFTGGEPLLRCDFSELYVFARKLGLRVILFTNATLITARLADLFARIPALAPIEVSVYGMSKASYEAVTQTHGSFAAFRKGVCLLLERKIPFIVKGVLLPHNKGDVAACERWAMAKVGMDSRPSFSAVLDKHFRRDAAKNRLICALRSAPKKVAQFYLRHSQRERKMMRQFLAKFCRLPEEKLFTCGAGIGSGCVTAYGKFQPCLTLRDPDWTYDLNKGSLEDALKNFFPGLCTLKAQNPRYRLRCARCFLKSLCEQCPAKSWLEHGTLDTPVEYYCAITHERARSLGIIRAHEKTWNIVDWHARIQRFKDHS